MKKNFPLTMFLLMAVFFSGCQGFISPKKDFSSIKIVLPGKNYSSREAETVKTEDSEVTQNNLELNFIFTVSDKDGEKVSLEGKSGETLVAEVEPGIYSVSLKGYFLEDKDFVKPYCEAFQDGVEVVAGEVTKISLALEILESDIGGVDINLPEIQEEIEITVMVDGELVPEGFVISQETQITASIPDSIQVKEIFWSLGDSVQFAHDFEDGNSITFASSLFGKGLGKTSLMVHVIDQGGKEYSGSFELIFTGDN